MEVMRAWQYSKVGRLEENLQLKTDVPRPTAATLQEDQVLVQVLYASLNPADLKHAQLGLFTKLKTGFPATPGYDFCGRVQAVHPSNTIFKSDDVVFGCLGHPMKEGTLADYLVVSTEVCVRVPQGVLPNEAAGIGGAGLTAYQSIIPFVQKGQKVFINGGSGGVGLFAIQIARARGIDVTVSCSARNQTLCEQLGARVIDYTRGDLIDLLQQNGVMFDLIVDNVGKDHRLFEFAHLYTTTEAKFIQVGGEFSTFSILKVAQRALLPGFLSGGKRKFQIVAAESNVEYLTTLGNLVAEKKVRVVIDKELSFGQAIDGFRKLRTGRTRGKIILSVQNA